MEDKQQIDIDDEDKHDNTQKGKTPKITFQLSSHLVKAQTVTKKENIIDVPLSRKAYMALQHYQHLPELTAILERAHRAGNDQRHHIEVPLQHAECIRHSIDSVIRKLTVENRKGRCDYGTVTIKNLRHASSVLHNGNS